MKPLIRPNEPASWLNPYGYWPKGEHWDILLAIYQGDDDALERWRKATDIDTTDSGMLRMLPLLYRRLKNERPDDASMPRLKSKYRYTIYRNNLTLHRLRGVVEALEAAGIPVLYIKGLSLVIKYYQDIGLRPMNDWDISVPFKDYERACNIIASCGFNPQIPVSNSYRHVRSSQGWEDANSFEIDIHWRCLPGRIRGDLPAVWNRATKHDFRGMQILTPCAEVDLLGVLHHGLSPNPTSPIRWVADSIEILDKAEIDWDLFLSLCPGGEFRKKLGPAFRFIHALRPEWELPFVEEYSGRLEDLREDYTPQKRDAGIWPYIQTSYSLYREVSEKESPWTKLRFSRHYLRYHFSLADDESLAGDLSKRALRRVSPGAATA
ncbi:nucleotidyltransferase family protein [Cerasicoccus frondis]|uniref:nucleotidyltransferase family protein n=1 Tax=Cerasicoccus frondis TaxID=490090 RepID=UPI0028526FF4|nr:nucleotidyltransferase family protein [Cerasicoccus frondis]